VVDARPAPYHGRSRAPFTGLRVVATRRRGSSESCDASNRAPLPIADTPAHPPTGNVAPVAANPRSTVRRDALFQFMSLMISDDPGDLQRSATSNPGRLNLCLNLDPGNSRASVR
jgi:hypothetical protein